METHFEIAVVTPDRPRLKKKKHHPALAQKKEMLTTIHQRTQDDCSYEYPAARVPITIFCTDFFVDSASHTAPLSPASLPYFEHTLPARVRSCM